MKSMLHPNVKVRVGAHQIFAALLIPSSNRPRHEVASLHSGCVYEPRRWHSNTASAFESISASLEKLRREKDGIKLEKNGYSIHEDFKGKDNIEEDRKQGLVMKSSRNIYNITSIIDKTAASNMVEAEPYIMKLTEDQIMQLLSGFWIQATLSDNMPSNIEPISLSFALTLISVQLKNIYDDLVVPFFQLPLSLKNIALDPSNAKICQIPDLIDLIKPVVPFDADSYLGISEDFQVFLEVDDLTTQLSEPFTPDDAFMFGSRSTFDLDHNQMIPYSKQSLYFDEDIQTSSLVEDDTRSEVSVVGLSHFIQKVAASSSASHVTDIGQLLQSALEVAGRVAATSVSTSPLPYDTMASQCEALGTGTMKKLSNWLAHEKGVADKIIPTVAADRHAMMLQKMSNESALTRAVSQIDPCLSKRLPPASPFDNFLKAARC
ncbi:hypothetical protein F3Y22_tig00111149pilonHSYRG00046 [Hibiscus syriacus]|uniref:Uncharacterized protein n=1 Tax=Hibiscus syriacus TaxID=106335 RepID=A0A6A2YXL1_HIBSY|nr:hypothetical protein F3Y22_tig00111149pilonHSYRG00046 [Hibiscus syriacus]